MGHLHAVTIGAIASLLLHVTLMVVLSNIRPRDLQTRLFELEFAEAAPTSGAAPGPQAGAGGSQLRTDTQHQTPTVFGAQASTDNVRNNVRSRAGESNTPKRVTLLITELAAADLRSTPWNTTALSQLQRIRTAARTSSYEDRRATPNPNNAVMLSTGTGRQNDRLLNGPRNFGVGSEEQTTPATSSAGTEQVTPTRAEGWQRASSGPSVSTSPSEAAAQQEAARRARVRTARPELDRANASTQATVRARSADNINAANLAATLVESWVDATDRRAYGAQDSQGMGGGTGAGTSTGNSRLGGSATAFAPGSGQLGALNTDSPVFIAWLGEQKRKVARALHYPRARALALDQGRTVYRVQLLADGRLASPPHLVRSSGFTDLDDAAKQAIEASAPFSALPPELLMDKTTIGVLFPVEFANPMTH